MSAAFVLPMIWASQTVVEPLKPKLFVPGVLCIQRQPPIAKTCLEIAVEDTPETEPVVNFAFYRKHTEKLLRRYLYASMQVGRTPNLLEEAVDRGWVSSRKVRTFEDALIFVLDIECCFKRLSQVDRQLISRIILQEYTYDEAAVLIGVSARTVSTKLPKALDRLTEKLVAADLLVLPG